MIPQVIIVGADKGGVGKTFLSRVLLDYLRDRPGKVQNVKAFDTEAPGGILKRFFPQFAEVVDLTKSDGQMRVFDRLKPDQLTLLDIRASQLTPTLELLGEIGFLDNVKAGKLRITVLHVIGSTQASFDEIRAIAGLVDGARHSLVINHITDAEFLGLPVETRALPVINIGKLNDRAAELVDSAGVSFSDFVQDEGKSPVMRGFVRSWLKRVSAELDAAGLID
ncbi:hypothetical protein ABIF38_006433 [Bradyrhizobium japonicum]|uniref:hypothetical protein n=1 Tax=Bradyrhizobium elkanii TaxID=29448 RepID=UPI00036E8800|nr:hypothetical protein [Bradyrhizobium elkanii]WAX24364.1 hypothetical protein [Bradyrhizobium phage ppBeUSDA76-1]MCP1731259.1 hypothetical protein [Bradyrhizobium elkanii]MCS3575388.1 hypothetical protein [Bradyrhizobium elkanii]MCS3591921.1 hypothetical protein [Bradyrhizobium elkanii]MCS3621366.1 hypothetical protein [Bradyrhizobium elkanii]